jgi:hypothetical protein
MIKFLWPYVLVADALAGVSLFFAIGFHAEQAYLTGQGHASWHASLIDLLAWSTARFLVLAPVLFMAERAATSSSVVF